MPCYAALQLPNASPDSVHMCIICFSFTISTSTLMYANHWINTINLGHMIRELITISVDSLLESRRGEAESGNGCVCE